MADRGGMVIFIGDSPYLSTAGVLLLSSENLVNVNAVDTQGGTNAQ